MVHVTNVPFLFYGKTRIDNIEQNKNNFSNNYEIVLKYIEENPGKTLSQISYNLSIPISTLSHHLRNLEKVNKIIEEYTYKKRYFPINITKNEKIKYTIQNNNGLKEIIKIISIQKEFSLDDIVENTAYSKSVISKRLKILSEFEMVKKSKINKKIIYSLDQRE